MERPAFSLRRRVLSPPTLVSFALALAIIFFLVSRFSIDLGATGETVRRSNPLLFALALLVHYTTFPFRAARWRLLLKNAGVVPLPSVAAASRLILIGWFASSVTWFRLGDAYRAYAYAEESGAPLAQSGGTVLAERVMDVLLVFMLLLGGLLLLYADTDLRPSQAFLLIGSGLMAASLGLLVAMQLFWKRLAKLLPRRFQRAYLGFHQGTMRSFRTLPLVMALGLLGWLSEVGRLYLVVRATGLDVGFGLIMFVAVANALLTAVPLSPGGLGIVEPGIVGLLALALPKEQAVSVALLDRSISYLSIVVFGALTLLYHQRVTLRKARAPSLPGKGLPPRL